MGDANFTQEDFLEIVDVFRTLARWQEESSSDRSSAEMQSVHVESDLRYAH